MKKSLPLALLLVGAGLAGAADLPELTTRRAQAIDLIQAGKTTEAQPILDALREELAQSPAPSPEWMGHFHLYRFMAAYQAGRYAEAFAMVDAQEPHPYQIPPANQAYMASVCAELCLHLGKPVEEILAWGMKAAEKRLEAGDRKYAMVACANSWNAMALRDAEDRAAPLAEKLIEIARQDGKAEWILAGYAHLVVGERRAGILAPLTKLRDRLAADLQGVTLAPEVQAQRWQVEASMGQGLPPASNQAQLEQTLKK